MDISTVKKTARKYAIKNACDYGKANLGAVVSKVVAEIPGIKKDMKTCISIIKEVIDDVNKIEKGKLKEELSKYTFEKKGEERELKLRNAKVGDVKTRFPPEPSGYLHIGHAKALLLNRVLADKYKGKMVLRFDDTNPEKSKEEYVKAIYEDIEWLGIKVDKVSYTSDHMPEIYKTIEHLIKKGNAYVCTCTKSEIKENRAEGKVCRCRTLEASTNMKLWKNMLSKGFKDGEAIVRFKGNLKSENTALRDPTIARVISTPHYKHGDKYAVWPNYDLAVVVMDHLEGITHPMRSKEYELRNALYYAICTALGYKKPTIVEFSRLSIKNNPVSKRIIRPLVNAGKVLGWDDPRLMTIRGLRRRGILASVIKEFVLSFGLGKSESNPNLELLLTHNKKAIDPIANRYFAVINPIKIEIDGINGMHVKIPKHPKDINKGYREYTLTNAVYIDRADFKDIEKNAKKDKNQIIRLKGIGDIIKENGKWKYAGIDKNRRPRTIHWVPEDYVSVKLAILQDLMKEDGSFNESSIVYKEAIAEPLVKYIKPREIIQFERVGFFIKDSKMSIFIKTA